MKLSQAIAVLILIIFSPGCKKEAKPLVSVSNYQNFRPGLQENTIYFPENGSASADLLTEIRLSLASAHFGSMISGRITVLGGGHKVPGKTNISANQITFVPDRELSPSEMYDVRVTISFEASPGDSRMVGIDGRSSPTPKNADHLDFSWTFSTREPYTYSMKKVSDQVTLFNRDGNKVMQVGDSLYTYGGWTAVPLESHNDVYRSAGDLSVWERVKDAPWVGRHTYGIGKLDSALFIFGGDHLSGVFDVWKTTDGSNFSQIRQDMNSIIGPRFLYGACVHNSRLFILGGQSRFEDSSGLTDVWTGRHGGAWSCIARNIPFLGKNISGGVASFKDRIWVAGGGIYSNDRSERTYTNEVYSSPDGVSWQREPDAPWTGRQYADLCVWNNRLWMIAGCDEKNLSDIWYMTEDGSWHEFQTPPDFEPRHASGVGVYDDKLVIVCGNYHNDCWVIEKE